MNPHIKNAPSPLRTLIGQALRRYGDFSGASVQGEAASMFIEFANAIIEDWNFHPHQRAASIVPLDYYASVDDSRCLPDIVVLMGLLMHYSAQQASDKFAMYQAQYYQALNREAYTLLTSGKNVRLEMRVIR